MNFPLDCSLAQSLSPWILS